MGDIISAAERLAASSDRVLVIAMFLLGVVFVVWVFRWFAARDERNTERNTERYEKMIDELKEVVKANTACLVRNNDFLDRNSTSLTRIEDRLTNTNQFVRP